MYQDQGPYVPALKPGQSHPEIILTRSGLDNRLGDDGFWPSKDQLEHEIAACKAEHDDIPICMRCSDAADMILDYYE